MSGDIHGADVVVLAGEADLAEIRDSAPAATLLVLGDARRCADVYETTLFPRTRVIGIEGAGDIAPAVKSILLERDEEHEVIALVDGEFAPRRARLGLRGITRLGER